ncbi:hypothetical protein MASR1M32_38930 [Rhodobacter sp.]
MTDLRPAKGPGLWARLARARPTRPGEIYGVPGQGNTFWLSVASVLALLVLWWLVTTLGLVKPLFVPSPQSVLAKFAQIWREGFTNTSFLDHVLISTARVFGAFILGLRHRPAARACDGDEPADPRHLRPRSNSTARFRRWPTCR